MYRWILISSIALILISHIPLYYCEDNIAEVVVEYKQPIPLELKCSSAPEGDEVKWFKDGLPVVAKENEYQIYPENRTMRVLKIEPKLIGVFVCKYNDSKLEMAFKILVRPFVTAFDKARNVIQGDPIRFECKAWGIPEPTITWFHGSNPLLPESSGKYTFSPYGGEKEPFPKVENGTVRIVEMDYNDGGNYTCFASNTIRGETSTANATVIVQVKDKYAALWPFLGICVEVAVLCTIILIYERRRAKRIAEEERQEEAAHLNANNETKPAIGGEEVRQRK